MSTKKEKRTKTVDNQVKDMWGKMAVAGARKAIKKAGEACGPLDMQSAEDLAVYAESWMDRAGYVGMKCKGI